MNTELRIDPEFRDLIPPLTDDERRGLEESLKKDGCRDPVVVWRGELLDAKATAHEFGGVCKSDTCQYSYKQVPWKEWVCGDGRWECSRCGYGIAPWIYEEFLIDGHNRKEICERLGIPFDRVTLDFADKNDAKVWIIKNQFSRRNLTPMQRVELVIKLEPLLTAKAEANRTRKPNSVPKISAEQKIETREELAKLANVSHDTVTKAKKVLASPVKELSRMTREGAVSINAAAAVAELPVERQMWVVDQGAQAVKDEAKVVTHAKRTESKSAPKPIQKPKTKKTFSAAIPAPAPDPTTLPIYVSFPNNPVDAAAVLAGRLPAEFVRQLIVELQMFLERGQQ